MLELNWGTCGSQKVWCRFESVDIHHSLFDENYGVYILWQEKGTVLKVGKGKIRDKVLEDRKDPRIAERSDVFFTWCSIESKYRSGVYRFLNKELTPKYDSEQVEDDLVKVNLPWPYKRV